MSRRNSIGSEIRVRAAAPGFTRSFTVRRMKNAASAGRMPIAKSQRQAMSSGRALNDQVGGVGERPADRVRALQKPIVRPRWVGMAYSASSAAPTAHSAPKANPSRTRRNKN
jgi:hypothetical protein